MPIGLLGDLRVFHQNQVSAPQVWNSPLFSKDPGVQGKVREHPAQMPWVPVVNTVLDGELQSSKGLAISAGDRGPVR